MYIRYHEIKMEKRKIENEIIWAFFPSCDEHIQAIRDFSLYAFQRERARAREHFSSLLFALNRNNYHWRALARACMCLSRELWRAQKPNS